jgi:LysR family hydrogen peroxide-inducible transcriptional activator
MTLAERKYFFAVSWEEHFGKTAEACFVSQSTLSVSIKELEEEQRVSCSSEAHEATVIPLGEDDRAPGAERV